MEAGWWRKVKMKGIRAVFLIKSPLQLLNAMEARHHFALAGEECLLLNLADRKSRSQIEAMIRHSGAWPCVCCVSDLPLFYGGTLLAPLQTGLLCSLLRSRILAFRRLSRLAQCLGEVERIFIGDYRELPMRHLVNILPHRETVLLDDGTATLTIAESRLQGFDQGRPLSSLKQLKCCLKRMLLGMRSQELEALTFFSVYHFRTRLSDRLVANNYGCLQQKMANGAGAGEVYFLGSPLIEADILGKAEHLAHLAAVRDHFAGDRLVYIAHRRESRGWLQQVEGELGIEVRHFEFPIEYQIAMVGPKPRVLASFLSSALGNCQLIFGQNLKISAFRLEPGSYRKKEAVDRVYAWYQGLAGPCFCIQSLPPLMGQENDAEEFDGEQCPIAVSPR
jgi:hypothetical protein